MQTELAFDDADLNGFVDGRIEPSRAAALAESLASDPEATARLDAWRRQNDSLRTMFASVLFEPVPVRLMPVAVPPRRIDACTPSGEDKRGGRLLGVLATTSIGMALIGFALGALASVGTDGFGFAPVLGRASGTAPSAQSETRDLVSRAAEAHRTFLPDFSHPVDLATAEEPGRRTGHRPVSGLHVPNLSRLGWTFLGSHVVPGRHGAAAFLAYGDGSDRLGLTIARGIASGEGRVTTVDEGSPPLGVATWADGEVGYALTANRGRDWLVRNLPALRDSVRAQGRTGDGEAVQP